MKGGNACARDCICPHFFIGAVLDVLYKVSYSKEQREQCNPLVTVAPTVFQWCTRSGNIDVRQRFYFFFTSSIFLLMISYAGEDVLVLPQSLLSWLCAVRRHVAPPKNALKWLRWQTRQGSIQCLFRIPASKKYILPPSPIPYEHTHFTQLARSRCHGPKRQTRLGKWWPADQEPA